MRPRKMILLYGCDELPLRATTFALGLRDFAVQPVSNDEDFCGLSLVLHPHAVVFLVGYSPMSIRELTLWAKRSDPSVQTMAVIQNKFYKWEADPVDRVLRDASMEDIRNALRTLVLRKRGPKRHDDVFKHATPFVKTVSA